LLLRLVDRGRDRVLRLVGLLLDGVNSFVRVLLVVVAASGGADPRGGDR